ncbi:PIG-L deacetylase family protein [Luteolibacter marinus]|uniref:PIG-L deacetylase family protein n=1 Tax=Luteolibacter marinus TaxID=2776705 RepID=UPI00186610FD|nr:PIG-L family deacetylase [Luteolibacter marinus]
MSLSLHHPGADLFVPDRAPAEDALARTTHLAIGAHQDDLEFFAYHGIEACYRRDDRWFTGVTCTDGGGSSRVGPYGAFSDDEMRAIRADEQRKAATVGEYAAMIQLGYPSSAIKDPADARPVEDLLAILQATRPEVVYLHNPADKHDTHIAVLLRCIAALRRLPADQRPKQAWGCEIWRGLDWLLDEDKGVLPVSARPNLQAALNGIFDSQITGGKRYDLAVMGRRLANATFYESHASDTETGLSWAMDLTPLLQDESLDIATYTTGYVDRLKADIQQRIHKFL